MGYYSIYRIIKDIIRNLKKNKLLVIIGIVILCLFFCNKVFGYYEFNDTNGTSYQLPDEIQSYKYFIVFKSGNYYWFIASNTEMFISSVTSDYRIGFKTPSQYIRSTGYYTNINQLANATFNTYYKDSSYKGLYSTGGYAKDSFRVYLCNYDLKNNETGEVFFQNNVDTTKYPQITTSLEDLQTLNFDTISVSAWDWSNKNLYILFYDRSLMNNQDTQGLYPKKEIKLAKDTSYFIPEISSEENAIYWVANDNTGLNFKVGGKYEIRLAERVPQSTGRWLSW